MSSSIMFWSHVPGSETLPFISVLIHFFLFRKNSLIGLKTLCVCASRKMIWVFDVWITNFQLYFIFTAIFLENYIEIATDSLSSKCIFPYSENLGTSNTGNFKIKSINIIQTNLIFNWNVNLFLKHKLM